MKKVRVDGCVDGQASEELRQEADVCAVTVGEPEFPA
jgi:hypothetical protein